MTIRAKRFSLVEWLVVLAVIGMVLGVILPRIGVVPSAIRVSKTTGTIRAAFQTALSRSMASGEVVEVLFDFPNHRLYLEKKVSVAALALAADDDTDPGAEEDNEQPDGSAIFNDLRMFELDERTDLNTELVERPDNARILCYKFYPNGEAVGPVMPIVIDDRWFTIDVDRLTGRPLIKETEEDE